MPTTMPSRGATICERSVPVRLMFVAMASPSCTMSPGATWKVRNPPLAARSHFVVCATTRYAGSTGSPSIMPKCARQLRMPRMA